MKIAVIGSGISGLVCAHLLHDEHQLTVFEAGEHIGGHTLTSAVERGGRPYQVDAGFVVYNEVNYPNFVRLLARLGVATQPTSMSFSVTDETTGLEYCGTSLDTLFAQRRNLVRPSFWRLLRSIDRFNREARELLRAADWRDRGGPTLGRFLADGSHPPELAEQYLLPMTAAIWSTRPSDVLDVPALFLLRFLDNHNLLAARGHHTWRVVSGGSARYVEALVRPFRDRIRLATPVTAVRRVAGGVEIAPGDRRERFDQAIVATHSDQALALLADPSPAEREVLGAIPYQPNRATLHTDDRLLPTSRRARASWNYRRLADGRLAVTYDMCRLQGLDADPPFCVSLNLDDRIDRAKVIRRIDFSHPLFNRRALAAQRRHGEISGIDRVHYCGAYWRNGFHEDGVVSALEVCRRFGRQMAAGGRQHAA